MEETVLRTHLAGDLRKDIAGQSVTLTGWVARRRDHGGVIFIDLRDRSGLAQVVFRESAVAEAAHDLRSEYVIQVTGVVEPRPEGSENPNLPSGEIEINVSELNVLNKSAALPFQIEDASSGEVGEETRLKYRYLDLRRERQANALRLRSKANKAARDVLDRHDFTEIETPTLTRSTPEARVTSSCRHACAQVPGTRCRSRHSCSSSCSWLQEWSVTTRSRAATATRTSVPTASRNLPS